MLSSPCFGFHYFRNPFSFSLYSFILYLLSSLRLLSVVLLTCNLIPLSVTFHVSLLFSSPLLLILFSSLVLFLTPASCLLLCLCVLSLCLLFSHSPACVIVAVIGLTEGKTNVSSFDHCSPGTRGWTTVAPPPERHRDRVLSLSSIIHYRDVVEAGAVSSSINSDEFSCGSSESCISPTRLLLK